MKRQQYTRQTARQAKPQRVTQAQVRKAIVAEIAEDKDRVALINAKLASAYALMSIATLYVDEMAEILHRYGAYIPFVEDRIRMMNGNFDGLRNEVNKLFIDDDGKRRLMEDINELREMLDKFFGFEEDDEPCENEK
jgi:hypothetical protein